MNDMLEAAFAELKLIQTAHVSRHEITSNLETYREEARNDPYKEFAFAFQWPLLDIYTHESHINNAKVFIRIIMDYYQQWCDDKLGYEAPDMETINAKLSAIGDDPTETEPVNFMKTRKYWKRVVERNQLDEERPYLFSESKRRQLKRSRE